MHLVKHLYFTEWIPEYGPGWHQQGIRLAELLPPLWKPAATETAAVENTQAG
jgi:hypothetical protein